jgi:fatty-acid desaturase
MRCGSFCWPGWCRQSLVWVWGQWCWYQIGSVVVVPVLLLVVGQISGVMYFSVGAVLLIGLAIRLLNGVLLTLGSRSFQRGRLLAS